MPNNNHNLNDSEIGVVVDKDNQTRVSLPPRCEAATEIHYIDIESYIKFIDRVFSVKEHYNRVASTETRQ